MRKNSRQCVFLLSEGGGCPDAMVLGGKGVGLVEMARLGAPVPPAFIVRTGVARAASQGQLPKERLAWHIERGMRVLERQTGKQFGDKSNPLLVSVRSGAPVSMPGMMDTILNLGLTPENFNGLVQQFGSSVADDIRVRFVKMFHNVVYVVDKGKLDQLFEDIEERADRKDVDVLVSAKIPVSPWKQLNEAIAAVHDSWNSERAKLYRQEHKIPDWWGTAVVVQAMVFGNRGEDSCSGVVFSRNVATGDDGLYGEFLVKSQGEDVVAGVRTPLPIARMQTWNPQIHGQLAEIVRQLEKHYNDVVDVEFTVEAGRLYILQCRVAKRTPEAALTLATHFVWEKQWTKEEALEKVSPKQISALSRPGFDEKALAEACVIGRGIPASPGAAGGMAVFSSEKAVALAKTGVKVVLVRPDTSPDDLPGIMAAEAVVTEVGGMTSHAAVVTRSLGKPCVLGCKIPATRNTYQISVDGGRGLVVKGEIRRNKAFDKKEVNIFRRWAQGPQCSSKWPEPRLNLALAEESVSVNQLINDFYLSSAMATAAVGTGMAVEADRLMKRIHVEAAERLATYLALAVASELSHATVYARYSIVPAAEKAYDKLMSWSVFGHRSEYLAAKRAREQLATMGKDEQTEFFSLARVLFGDCQWTSSSIGGRKWAKIAEAGRLFLSGECDHTVFADHAFDLQHNSGAVFGKHEMLVFDSRALHRQLEIKKQKVSVELLYRLISIHGKVGPEVEEMFVSGQSLGLWAVKPPVGSARKSESPLRDWDKIPTGKPLEPTPKKYVSMLEDGEEAIMGAYHPDPYKKIGSLFDASGSMSAADMREAIKSIKEAAKNLAGPLGTGKSFMFDHMAKSGSMTLKEFGLKTAVDPDNRKSQYSGKYAGVLGMKISEFKKLYGIESGGAK